MPVATTIFLLHHHFFCSYLNLHNESDKARFINNNMARFQPGLRRGHSGQLHRDPQKWTPQILLYNFKILHNTHSCNSDDLQGPPYQGAWIGFQWVNNGWEWTDGSPWDYARWVPGQPNSAKAGDCGHFWRCDDSCDETKGWADTGCTIVLPYICKVQPNAVEV